jgi:transposase InsO family protein
MGWEKEAIVEYCRERISEGYRRLTYMMIDEDIAAVSPASVYRILREKDLLYRWNGQKSSSKGNGFKQPKAPHEHWHMDIAYINVMGTFMFLISVLDGYSRMILHHELRTTMTEYDVQITLQRALEKYPGVHPRLITDNGKQFVAKDFKEYLRDCGLKQVRTSVYYPQSNGKIERFHGTIKTEAIRQQSYLSIDDARRQIDEYIRIYNEMRLHSALFYLTPKEVFEGKMNQRLAERQKKLDQAAEYRKKLSLFERVENSISL